MDSRNPLWKTLASSYSIKWKYLRWRRQKTLSIWDDYGKKYWFNCVGIDVLDGGLVIYFSILQAYRSAILIPWEDIDVKGKVFVGVLGSLKVDSLASQELYIKDKGIHLAIPYSYRNEIDMKKTGAGYRCNAPH
jgi:hypothetical protein